ncbi:MAG: hypothetical protein RLZZ609_195 [Cyanobacteriota bacterium]|jgi:hypothetical protein
MTALIGRKMIRANSVFDRFVWTIQTVTQAFRILDYKC